MVLQFLLVKLVHIHERIITSVSEVSGLWQRYIILAFREGHCCVDTERLWRTWEVWRLELKQESRKPGKELDLFSEGREHRQGGGN